MPKITLIIDGNSMLVEGDGPAAAQRDRCSFHSLCLFDFDLCVFYALFTRHGYFRLYFTRAIPYSHTPYECQLKPNENKMRIPVSRQSLQMQQIWQNMKCFTLVLDATIATSSANSRGWREGFYLVFTVICFVSEQ